MGHWQRLAMYTPNSVSVSSCAYCSWILGLLELKEHRMTSIPAWNVSGSHVPRLRQPVSRCVSSHSSFLSSSAGRLMMAGPYGHRGRQKEPGFQTNGIKQSPFWSFCMFVPCFLNLLLWKISNIHKNRLLEGSRMCPPQYATLDYSA